MVFTLSSFLWRRSRDTSFERQQSRDTSFERQITFPWKLSSHCYSSLPFFSLLLPCERLSLDLIFGLIVSFHFWFRDLLREFLKKYEVLLIIFFLVFLLFLVSEGLLFVSFFWTSFHIWNVKFTDC